MNPAISASILAADVACLGDEVDHVLLAGAGRVHLDVMDHHYVPNLTFGPLVCEGLRRHGIEAPIDVHLRRNRWTRLFENLLQRALRQLLFIQKLLITWIGH